LSRRCLPARVCRRPGTFRRRLDTLDAHRLTDGRSFRSFASPVRERQPTQIVAIEPEEIEGACDSLVLEATAVQPVEVGATFLIGADHLCVDNSRDLDPRRFLDNARIPLRPIGSVHRLEAHFHCTKGQLQWKSMLSEISLIPREIRLRVCPTSQISQ
jgi:hypothetical protein